MDVVDVCIYPAAKNYIEPISLPDDFPSPIVKAINDAEQAFRAGLYSPALTCGGRALEGIFLDLSSKKEGKKESLNKLIEELCSGEGALVPLKSLAHAIREGRNVGAHFDEDIEPSERSAALLIELLHSLVAYFYLLPVKSEELRKLTRKSN